MSKIKSLGIEKTGLNLRGLKVGLAILLLSATAGSSAWALSTQSTLATSVTVNSVFRLTLGTFRGGAGADRFDLVPVSSINFGNVSVGQFSTLQPSVVVTTSGSGTSDSGLILKAETNQGNVWRFQVSENRPLTRNGGSETIADANFKYFTFLVAGEGNGTLATLPLQNPDLSRFNTMSTTPFNLYTSSAGEGFTTDTRIHMQFGVQVPSVVPGTYSNNVVITLTE